MEEYIVIKKGASIRQCIDIPPDFMDIDLEIKIRPLKEMGKLAEKIEKIYAKYPDAKPFKDIEDPVIWQDRLRDEWE